MPRKLIELENTLESLRAIASVLGRQTELSFESRALLAEVEALYIIAQLLESISKRLELLTIAQSLDTI